MAHEINPQIKILRAPKEGLLSQDMSTNAELHMLKRRVDVLMTELAGLKEAHRALKKYVTKPWYKRIFK